MPIPDQYNITCIIPTIPSDYLRIKNNIIYLKNNLNISRLVFIGPKALADHICTNPDSQPLNDDFISFVDEESILPIQKIKKVYDDRYNALYGDGQKASVSSANWYYQQFLKLAYCYISDTDYYLCWDSDTIPLHKINMFNDDNIPVFDIKAEFQPQYFKTIQNLFGFEKTIEASFVSEHMLFRKDYVMEMLEEIISSTFDGNTFYEKIFNATEDLKLGFSEFETYGTWISMRHTSSYRLRKWKSLRNTSFMVNIDNLTEDDISWLSKSYDAASFEKYQETEPVLNELFKNRKYREKLSAERFYHELLELGCFGEYKDGKVITEHGSFPV